MPRATALLLSVALPLAVACSSGTDEDPPPTYGPNAPVSSATPVEDTLARDRLAALVSKEEWAAARRTLAEVVHRAGGSTPCACLHGRLAVCERRALWPTGGRYEWLGRVPPFPLAVWALRW